MILRASSDCDFTPTNCTAPPQRNAHDTLLNAPTLPSTKIFCGFAAVKPHLLANGNVRQAKSKKVFEMIGQKQGLDTGKKKLAERPN
jgi:hypothetical protein